jgi:hypothetical protein
MNWMDSVRPSTPFALQRALIPSREPRAAFSEVSYGPKKGRHAKVTLKPSTHARNNSEVDTTAEGVGE